MILFAKAPIPGRVKTRLLKKLSPEQAASLHSALVAGAWRLLQTVPGDAELHTDVETDAWPEISPRKIQAEGDLGVRMYTALEAALSQGRPRAMILGSDAPALPESHLTALLNSNADVALGPTEDGGYYAISCRRVRPEMFDGVRWSTRHALTDTTAAALRCGLSIQVGAPWFDVDEPEDLVRLGAYPELSGFAV